MRLSARSVSSSVLGAAPSATRWVVPPLVAVSCGTMILLGSLPGARGATEPASRSLAEVTPLQVPSGGKPGFSPLSAEITHVTFTNQLRPADLAKNQILEVGSGVALGDVDGDGLTDIYLCSMGSSNRLYRNLGDWKFEDVTTQAGVGCDGQFSTGSVLADIDGDGLLDLLVNAIGSGTRLFRNRGGLRFTESNPSGLIAEHGSTSLALADINGDGYLDLYVANYHTRTVKDSPSGLEVQAGYVGGKFVIEPPGLFLPLPLKSGGMNLFERGEPDVLYLNNGRGGFAAVDWTQGRFREADGSPLAEAPKDWGLCAAFRDLNGDGHPDLYVCNDFFHSPDRLWINDGSGNFRAAEPFVLRQTSMSSMSADFADINRDGRDDIFVLDMLSREHQRRHRQRGSLVHLQVSTPMQDPLFRPETARNTLQVQRSDGTFAELAQYSGLEASEWSWGVAFLDVDLDGFEDALVTNGNIRDANDADLSRPGNSRMDSTNAPKSRDKNLRFPPLETANLAFRNRGDLTFEEVGETWGFATRGVSHGMAMADLDNDGDQDLVVNHLGQAVGLYRNNSSNPRVFVRLHGRAPNVQAIGARVELRGGAVPTQTQEIMSGGRYLSGDDPTRSFAAGTLTNRMELRVRWRNGTESTVVDIRANQRIEVHEPEPSLPKSPPVVSTTQRRTVTFFNDVSERLRHAHQENLFNEAERQPLLTRELGRLGPGLAWKDLDADGREDLIVGGSRGGYFVVYLNEPSGKFKPLRRKQALQRDQTALLAFVPPGSEATQLLAGSANYEEGNTNGSLLIGYDLQKGTETGLIPDRSWSAGPLAIGVTDRTPMLFVGGRVHPGRYPAHTGSALFQFREGAWVPVPEAADVFQQASLVSGATWADLDGDGSPELLAACEWGPLRVYARREGSWKEETDSWQLAQFTGLWNGIAAGDFDEDGRLDFVASNWGRNTRYERHRAQPLRLYYGEWTEGGPLALSESYFEPTLGDYAPFVTLDRLRASYPAVSERYAHFVDYSRITCNELFSAPNEPPHYLTARWLDTTLFLNRGDHFEPHALPAEAQWAPAFGVSIGDLDGDGHEDVVLSQNFSGMLTEEGRLDGARGLWLRGDGKGGMQAVDATASGLRIVGDGRGTALCDYDGDGRPDLAVAQNNGPVKLYHNDQGRPGLRVRLRGPQTNPEGIGTVVRVKYGHSLGPARSFALGSGYWSQESSVQVLGLRTNDPPTALWIRWANGTVSETPLPRDSRDVLLTHPSL